MACSDFEIPWFYYYVVRDILVESRGLKRESDGWGQIEDQETPSKDTMMGKIITVGSTF